MTGLPDILDSVAALLWPLIVVFVILLFRPAVAAIVESARSRRFTLKIGGQELTMEEVNEQQRSIISDLQSEVSALRESMKTQLPEAPARQPEVVRSNAEKERAVLWVDDNPKNNSFLAQQLLDAGVSVDLALSTADGAARLSRRRYAVVISDMGRTESGAYNPKAGLDFLRAVRAKDSVIPFLIYCSRKKAMEFGEEARELGATHVTSSPTQLAGILEKSV